jgi:hypothetical protein
LAGLVEITYASFRAANEIGRRWKPPPNAFAQQKAPDMPGLSLSLFGK